MKVFIFLFTKVGATIRYQLVCMEMPETKRKLLDATVSLMCRKGYNGTSVDDICAAASVTKGAFFHYFKSKEGIATAALERFALDQEQRVKEAPFCKLSDPLERVYGRLDFVKESIASTEVGCPVGTVAQEMSLTNPEFHALCQGIFLRMAQDFARDLAEAKAAHEPTVEFDPEKMAVLFVSVFQGSTLLAKASDNNELLIDNIELFRSYLKSLFGESRIKRPVQPMETLDMALD